VEPSEEGDGVGREDLVRVRIRSERAGGHRLHAWHGSVERVVMSTLDRENLAVYAKI
jgi:hypothetical protein